MMLLPATAAFSTGNCFSAVDDRLDDERQVGELLPGLRLELRRAACARMRATRVRSISKNDVTCALVWRDATM